MGSTRGSRTAATMQLLERIDMDRMLGEILASGMPPGKPGPNTGGDESESGHGQEAPEEEESDGNPS